MSIAHQPCDFNVCVLDMVGRWTCDRLCCSPVAIQMTSITYHGIPPILTSFARRAKKIEGSCFGMLGVRHVAARRRFLSSAPHSPHITPESRHIQSCSLKVSPVQTNYSPDGRSLLYASAGHQLFFMTYAKDNEGGKEQWISSNKDPVSLSHVYSLARRSRIHDTPLTDYRIDGIVQPRWRRHRPHAPFRAHSPSDRLPISHSTGKSSRPRRRLCCSCTGPTGKVGRLTTTFLSGRSFPTILQISGLRWIRFHRQYV
jgi:hypothetical protein